jgi:predicted RNA-binding protein with PUA-like domain
MKYWLFKTEPDSFGVDDLARSRDATTAWDGVRNYQARNMLRDEVRRGDLGFLYHSSCEVPAIVAVVRVVKEGYADASAFLRRSPYYDPESDPDAPRWYSVDVRLERRIEPPITLEELRKHARGALKEMLILRRGNRLSVTPVTATEWRFIESLRR